VNFVINGEQLFTTVSTLAVGSTVSTYGNWDLLRCKERITDLLLSLHKLLTYSNYCVTAVVLFPILNV
jgi:hypothetical protein